MKLKTRIKISMVGIMAAMVAIYTAIILARRSRPTAETWRLSPLRLANRS